MSKNILERFWSVEESTSEALHTAMKESLEVIINYFDSSRAAKENLLKTDIRVANNVLNTFAKMRQAESGMIQALTVLGERQAKSDEFKRFIQENLPQIEVSKKLPASTK